MRFDVLGLAAGWVLVVFVGLLCLTFLIKVWTNEINISRVISEPNGDASLSRLQFLIFTVVISMSLFLVIMENQPQPAFPVIPDQIMVLLGISGSSYLVSKGIQFSNPAGVSRPALQLSATPAHVTAPSATVVLSLSVPSTSAGTPVPTSIRWSLDEPALGSIASAGSGTATYTAPASLPAAPTKVKVRAQADGSGFDDGTVDITLS
ncbi:MAG TPA: hypothetical protein VK752_25510 [Bryobacteraceae bacterium]|jgi:hypothetical protein|nr:hypothetical protein [Bryobacteraceae bacterium]